MDPWRPSLVLTTDNLLIALVHVESLEFSSEEDATFDKLVDDIVLTMCTVSGAEHRVSIREQAAFFDLDLKKYDMVDYQNAIIKKWSILTGK